MHCLSNRNCRGRHRISPLCSTVPLDWFPLRAVRNNFFLSLNDAELCPQKRVCFKFLVLSNQFHCTFSCCCACLQHPVFEDVKSFQSGLPPAAQAQFLGIEMENRLGQPGPAIGGGVFYWIGGVVCQMGDRRNPGNNGGQIEYKKALCSILKTFRQTTEGFRFIVQYLNGGAFDSPFSEKVEFCISGFVILKKRSQIFDSLTFCCLFSRFLLIYAKTPHFRAVFLPMSIT